MKWDYLESRRGLLAIYKRGNCLEGDTEDF